MEYYSTQYWNRGKRKKNEDSLCIEQVRTRKGSLFLACICDGIGGLSAGETASGYTVETLADWFQTKGIRALQMGGLDYLAVCMKRELSAISRKLSEYGSRAGIRLGTTASVLVLWQNAYLILQVGDSRIYRIRHGVKMLTRDQVNHRGELVQGVGVSVPCTPGMDIGRVHAGDRFLLCSDGFYRKQSGRELAELFGSPYFGMLRRGSFFSTVKEPGRDRQPFGAAGRLCGWERKLAEVAERLYRRGETDNISAVLVFCERGGRLV